MSCSTCSSNRVHIQRPYLVRGVIARDPFIQLDIEVAMLLQMSVRKARQTQPGVKVCIPQFMTYFQCS